MENKIKFKGLWTPNYLAVDLLFPKPKSIDHAEMRLKAWAEDILDENKSDKFYVAFECDKYGSKQIFGSTDKDYLIQKLVEKIRPDLSDFYAKLDVEEIYKMVEKAGEYKIIEVNCA